MNIPESEFDPRAPKADSREVVFEKYDLEGEIVPEMLHPPTYAYRLGPEDLLDIEISEIPDTLARTFVMPDGMVYYDLAGGVKAEGLTTSELSDRLAEALRRDYADPVVNVTLIEVKSRRFWILGRVYKPGLYPLRQPTTILEAVSSAGGLFSARFSGSTEELADLGNSVIIRDNIILPVDFKALIRDGDTSQNIYLEPNDFIYLPSAQSSTVLLLGAVVQPTAVNFRDSVSLVEAIAYGQGPRKDAFLSKVVIVRGSKKEPEVAVVNLLEIMKGEATDIALQPGDIVWVPQNPWQKLGQYVELILRDATYAVAINEGANFVGEGGGAVVTIPAGGN
ncbi:polysaccharide biosynthesis/export family protein [Rubellicoccus peritrichatus]|uniref:Polysaccharide biosynthesis/export family protein n=1 Tax=Rubellicoccus peritrichatus TaxID=3080537 RepID=A0AAQ3LEB3_9BACT|nr:polysaccharide biosynthesis/export family protein [Puniceicoccus sp. CR14]WOO42028.1 polysaccharide biosynthesis/export family protein [Puniceicoccus sp. CR14]